jgi:hypothetical protein
MYEACPSRFRWEEKLHRWAHPKVESHLGRTLDLCGAGPSSTDFYQCFTLLDLGARTIQDYPVQLTSQPSRTFRLFGLTVIRSVDDGHFVSLDYNIAVYQATLSVNTREEHELSKTFIVSESRVR